MPGAAQIPLTQQVDLTIADPKLLAEHPELHHYTKYAGLKGIIETNALRATHYRKLNDTMEINLLRQPLVETLGLRFRDVLRRRRSEREIAQAIEETGGLEVAAQFAAEGLVNSFYQVSFEGTDSFSFEPYITSFCTHAGWPYERENGLLSQWRGYGGVGGYCLVFDTAKLSARLGGEFDAHYYVHISLAQVIYADGNAKVKDLFSVLLKRNEELLDLVLDRGDGLLNLQDSFGPFIAGITCYKHQGFREEFEIRAVTIPATQEFAGQVQAENPGVSLRPIKPPLVDERGRPFVSLFSDLNRKLPIRRIIVGPSVHQAENAERARAVVGDAIPIKLSKTPYIEIPQERCPSIGKPVALIT
jgi:Protein of unknown function (DUF2971)